MKKFFLLLFIFPSLLNAQDSTSTEHPRFGLVAGISAAPSVTYGWMSGISCSYKKHEVFATLLLMNHFYNSNKIFPGFQGGYRFYLNGNEKRFDLLFEYDFAYINARYERPYFIDPNFSVTSTLIQSLNVIENYFSFGFRVNILRHLFVAPSFGIGVGKVEEKRYDKYSNGPTSYLYDYKSPFALTANLNITYHFFVLKGK